MSIELQPLGVTCNLKCTYCYQNPMRDAANTRPAAYDLDAMFASAQAEGAGQGTGLTVFGGEPLLLPLPELKAICERARALGAPIGLQSNGTLISEAHVALFKEFNVSVGLSIDGPDELNDSRWAGSSELTQVQTRASQDALERLCAVGLHPSLIVTLYRGNAAGATLPRLLTWVRDCYARGVRVFNFHTLEVDHALVESMRLTEDAAIAAAEALMDLETQLPGARFAPWCEMRDLLCGDDTRANCIWHACDPYLTDAVRGIGPTGQRQNCGRTNKDGVAWQKIDRRGHERQLALYLTPFECGGCGGCRFFFACKGECPGTGEGGDWRARTDHCGTLQRVFGILETRLVAGGREPLSQSLRRPAVEAALLAAWARGENMTVAAALAAPARGPIGDHPHGDAPHGDRPHGDHTDAAMQAAVQRECALTNHHDGPCARCGYGVGQ